MNNKFSLQTVVEEESNILDPFNENNIAITKKDINNIFKKVNINLKINNLNLYQKAFTHISYSRKKNMEQLEKNKNLKLAEKPDNVIDLQPFSYERLEFLGDSILGAIVTTYLFKRYQLQNEGFMTKLKTKLVNTKALYEFALYLGLSKFILLSYQVEFKNNGRTSKNILEDVFEALIGAIYLDFNSNKQLAKYNFNIMSYSGPGYQVCEKFIINIIESEVDLERLILKDTNYKDRLLRFYQHNYQVTPTYKEINIGKSINNKLYTMAVLDKRNIVISSASHKTKKKAEQKASKLALIKLGGIGGLEYYSDDDDED